MDRNTAISEILAIARKARIARELKAARAAVAEMPDEAYFDNFENDDDGATIGVGTVIVDDPAGDFAELQAIIGNFTLQPSDAPATQPRIDAVETALKSIREELQAQDIRHKREVQQLERERSAAIEERNEARLQAQRAMGYVDRVLERERLAEDPRPAPSPYYNASAEPQRGPQIGCTSVPF